MTARTFTLRNESGLHARPAARFVQEAATLTSDVEVENLDRPGGRGVNGKSILEVLTLGASAGQRIRVTTRGEREAADLERLARLIESGFGEAQVQHLRS
jgi:phosphotransferase system HPr (HPr) family protein